MDVMLVVDMQVGLLAGPPKHDLHGVIDRINRLAAMLRGRGGKVIWIRHCGDGDEFARGAPGWALPAGDSTASADDIVVEKTLNDPFAGHRSARGTVANRARTPAGHRLGHRLLRRCHRPVGGFKRPQRGGRQRRDTR